MARETRRSTTRNSTRQAEEENKAEDEPAKAKESTPKNKENNNNKKETETKKEEEEMMVLEEEQADSDSESDDSNDEAESSSSDEEPPVIEYMVQNRSRRSTAGNKMSALMATASQEDDFYKSAYGGFNEDEADDVFKSPVHSDEDEVDSDFDKPEEEDEPKSGGEEEEKRQKRRKFKEPSRGELIEKNRKWAVARMGGPTVPANVVDAKTQIERLKEAEETERVNVESLAKYEQFELERKKKREKAGTARKIPAPYISVKSTQSGNLLTVPDVKEFKRPIRVPKYLCAVTGQEARYKDPVTGLPYSCTYAFKVIRDKYTKYLKSIKGNPDVDKYLSNFEL